MIGAIGQYAIGEHPIDLSTPDYFQELLKRPYFDIVYLIELEPYDASIQKTEDGFGCIGATPIGAIGFDYTGGTKTYYFSDRGYITGASDSPAHTNYLPATNNPFQFDVGVFNGDFSGRSGSFGAIRLLNGDGDLDYLIGLYWAGRSVKVYAGAPDFGRDQFVKVLMAFAIRLSTTKARLLLISRTMTGFLIRSLSKTFIAEMVGLTVVVILKVSQSLLLYGECKHITPCSGRCCKPDLSSP